MVSPQPIHPDALYDNATLLLSLGIGEGTLARARRAEGLRFARCGGRLVYLGRWILDWLERQADGKQTDPREVAHVS